MVMNSYLPESLRFADLKYLVLLYAVLARQSTSRLQSQDGVEMWAPSLMKPAACKSLTMILI